MDATDYLNCMELIEKAGNRKVITEEDEREAIQKISTVNLEDENL